MKKNYLAPEAELLTFASEDVITSSGTLNVWNTPTIDLGTGGYTWASEDEDLTYSIQS